MHFEPARIVARNAELADHTLEVIGLQPVDEGLQTVDPDHRVGALGIVTVVVEALVILVEILMGLVNQLAGGVVDEEVGVALEPAMRPGPIIALDVDNVVLIDEPNRVDCGLGRVLPGIGGRHVVRFVHQIVAEKGGVTLHLARQLGPEVGKLRIGRPGRRAERLAIVSTVIVEIDDQVHAERCCIREHVLKQGQLGSVERPAQSRLHSFPTKWKSNEVNAMIFVKL